MKNIFLKISLLILTIPGLCFASEPVFTTYPLNTNNQNKWIITELNPGGNLSGKLALINLSDKTISLDLSVKNGYEQNNSYKIDETSSDSLAQWITLSQQRVTLSPKEKTTVDYTVNVPQDTAIKKYTGAILASYTEEGSGLKISSRIGNRIYLSVTNNSELKSNLIYTNLSLSNYFLIIISSLSLLFLLKLIRLQKYETKKIN